MQKLFATLVLWGCFSGISAATGADSRSDVDQAFCIQLDVAVFAESELGQRLVSAVTQTAAAEMEKDPQRARDAFVEAIGFDPLERSLRATIVGSNFENPQSGLRGVIELGGDAGNLEGLMLAIPAEQQTRQSGGLTVHSLSAEGETAYLCFDKSDTDNVRVVIATDESSLVELTGALRRADSLAVLDAPPLPAGAFLRARLFSLPEDLIEESPLSRLAGLLREAYSALWLRYGEDLPVRETAIALGKSSVATRVMLHRARTTLRKIFQGGADGLVPSHESPPRCATDASVAAWGTGEST